MVAKQTQRALTDLQPVAENGLLDRRAFFKGGAALAAAMSGYSLSKHAAAEPLEEAEWMRTIGRDVPAYGQPSPMEGEVVGSLVRRSWGGVGNRRTPHHLLNGTLTPSGLHFFIGHSGLPNINPAEHKLLIHGLVSQPLVFTLESLMRYPMQTRMAYVECGGNSAPLYSPEPIQDSVQALHGLSSCSEWTGVMLSTLLEETGVDAQAKWLIAEGAESIAHTRSVPVYKALDDAMIALYQNGERIRPEQGYPMRVKLIANPISGGDARERIEQATVYMTREGATVDLFLTAARGDARIAAAASARIRPRNPAAKLGSMSSKRAAA